MGSVEALLPAEDGSQGVGWHGRGSGSDGAVHGGAGEGSGKRWETPLWSFVGARRGFGDGAARGDPTTGAWLRWPRRRVVHAAPTSGRRGEHEAPELQLYRRRRSPCRFERSRVALARLGVPGYSWRIPGARRKGKSPRLQRLIGVSRWRCWWVEHDEGFDVNVMGDGIRRIDTDTQIRTR
ncbi:putative formin-like protein 6 isoform X1 [Iris pallida]|uniref:Formin-like protein 6 isoform X1 n=1 Tax=Iris pallida TaxID=29817 RepID=A0AAX6FXG7_IRIPA|nr:putative formin-like protein 6 isoform X1 [Iris pallida]